MKYFQLLWTSLAQRSRTFVVLCCVVFDFNNLTQQPKEKDIKRQTSSLQAQLGLIKQILGKLQRKPSKSADNRDFRGSSAP
ncbi:hypothetical protein PanWU01x14_122340 [Parasponia andersonii]|uniref:Uncharacterized protein n=1 Tax=Parasponia andersonii TaxID=3476 RepID=A0A2P5CUM5_PARAD|nr:hypothetical protein PanWU01x14_122340 [Parasponia andersonii]